MSRLARDSRFNTGVRRDAPQAIHGLVLEFRLMSVQLRNALLRSIGTAAVVVVILISLAT